MALALPAAAQDYTQMAGGEVEAAKETPKYTYLYDTSLIRALKDRDEERTRMLLYANVDANEKNDEGFTPLVVATEVSSPEIISMLLERGAKVNLPSLGDVTPLMSAAAAGRADIVQLLLEYGADPSMKDMLGLTPLLHAAKTGNLDTILVLLKVPRADINARDINNTDAVMFAAGRQDLQSLRALIVAGGNINAKNDFGFTPLILGVNAGDVNFVRDLIITPGIDIQAKDNTGRSALMHAVQKGNAKIVKMLTDVGADVNTRDWLGYTPALVAAKEGNNALLKNLLKLGADANAQDRLGRTILTWGIENKKRAIISIALAQPDVQVNTVFGDDALTPLMAAADKKDYATAKALITKHKAFVNVLDNNGRNALYHAVLANDYSTAALLIKHGADAAVTDNEGVNMISVALSNNNTRMADLLSTAEPVNALPEVIESEAYDEPVPADDDGREYASDMGDEEIVELDAEVVQFEPGLEEGVAVISAAPAAATNATAAISADNTDLDPTTPLQKFSRPGRYTYNDAPAAWKER